MSGARRWFGRAGLAAAACVAVPACVELLVQLAGDPRYERIDQQIEALPAYWKLAQEQLYVLDDRALRFRLRPGFRATVDGVEYRVNALGLRGPEVAREKPAGTCRVLLVGDSYAFGLGVAEEAGIAAQLEGVLNEQLAQRGAAGGAGEAAGAGGTAAGGRDAAGGGDETPATNVEVVNLGVPAYQTEQERLLLERVGFALEPDLVVLLYFANDKLPSALTWAPALNVLYHDDVPLPYAWKPVLARSFLYSLAARIEARRRFERGDYDSRGATHWPLTMRRLERFAADCAGRGVPFVLAAIPEMASTRELLDETTEMHRDHAAVVAFARERGWPLVDLGAGLLGKVKAFEKLFLSLDPVDTHFNPRGCRLTAELLAATALPLLP